jgi:hypothetical protein
MIAVNLRTFFTHHLSHGTETSVKKMTWRSLFIRMDGNRENNSQIWILSFAQDALKRSSDAFLAPPFSSFPSFFPSLRHSYIII